MNTDTFQKADKKLNWCQTPADLHTTKTQSNVSLFWQQPEHPRCQKLGPQTQHSHADLRLQGSQLTGWGALPVWGWSWWRWCCRRTSSAGCVWSRSLCSPGDDTTQTNKSTLPSFTPTQGQPPCCNPIITSLSASRARLLQLSSLLSFLMAWLYEISLSAL